MHLVRAISAGADELACPAPASPQPATDCGLLPEWQPVVDALVVAGVTRLADSLTAASQSWLVLERELREHAELAN
jgi:hypothetical protein